MPPFTLRTIAPRMPPVRSTGDTIRQVTRRQFGRRTRGVSRKSDFTSQHNGRLF